MDLATQIVGGILWKVTRRKLLVIIIQFLHAQIPSFFIHPYNSALHAPKTLIFHGNKEMFGAEARMSVMSRNERYAWQPLK